jgi:hypothetical protein
VRIFFPLLIAGAIAAACAHPAAATTGKELYAACTAKGGGKNLDCAAYIHGFVDGMIMGYTAHGTVRGYCPPVSGIAPARGRAIVETWLREHPERLGGDAGILAGLALAEAYPCKK